MKWGYPMRFDGDAQLLLFADSPIALATDIGRDEPERWADMVEFPGYQCSTHGRFRNRRTGHLLTGTVAHNGYVHIGMRVCGAQIWRLAHRVIAETFLPKPSADSVLVNHINRDRADNRAVNLEWVTPSQNAKHWIRLRTSGVFYVPASGQVQRQPSPSATPAKNVCPI